MNASRKPRDIGNGLVCASFGQAGEWLSLAAVDPEAGFVELTGLPLFDPALRGNVDAVLRFRSWMRREEHAFLRVDAGRATITTREDAPRGTRGVVQRLVIRSAPRDRPAGIRIRIAGRLTRPTLAEVREVDQPLSADATPAVTKSRFKAREGTLRVSGDGAPIIVQAWLRKGGDEQDGQGSAEGRSDMRLAWSVLRRRTPTAVAWVDWPDQADEVHLDIACTFDLAAATAPEWLRSGPLPRPAGPLPAQPASSTAPAGSTAPGRSSPPGRSSWPGRIDQRPLRVPARLVKPVGRLNQRAASYTRSCTALQVAGGERCILADHRILPLSWTRDAYWQARLLLATWARGGPDDDSLIVADHLRWLFLACERPGGRWGRSHHADGRRKDQLFRADQQLYPLLELADFAITTDSLPDLPPGRSWSDLAGEAWTAVEAAIDAQTTLLRTEVTPGDDIPRHPYLVSDQVLLWHVATRLAGVARQLGLARPPFEEAATRTRAAVEAHFVVDGPLGRQWASAVDGQGGAERDVDANDLPVALAPLWGFCRPTDRAWRSTMAFAFDARNPGFVPGVAGGLGSRHTPGTWTLGDIFAWVAFGLMADHDAAEAALARLVTAAFSDGMLPEAYDPDGSGAAVRHWFALPGAVLGALVLDHGARSAGSDAR